MCSFNGAPCARTGGPEWLSHTTLSAETSRNESSPGSSASGGRGLRRRRLAGRLRIFKDHRTTSREIVWASAGPTEPTPLRSRPRVHAGPTVGEQARQEQPEFSSPATRSQGTHPFLRPCVGPRTSLDGARQARPRLRLEAGGRPRQRREEADRRGAANNALMGPQEEVHHRRVNCWRTQGGGGPEPGGPECTFASLDEGLHLRECRNSALICLPSRLITKRTR